MSIDMEQTEPSRAPNAPYPEMPSLTNAEKEKYDAATSIQKTYRGHRTRRSLKGHTLSPSTRWAEAVKDAQFLAVTGPQPPKSPSSFSARKDSTTTDPDTGRPTPARAVEGQETQTISNADGEGQHSTEEQHKPTNPGLSPARQQWYRATKIARHAGADDPPSASSFDTDSLSSESSSLDDTFPSNESTHNRHSALKGDNRTARRARRASAQTERKRLAKMMDLQYFLEMVDHKHRYGSNLRKYHNHWKSQPTSQNFFYWLDHGEGAKVNLPECSRERLNSEQVRYLSREERLNYLVKVDGEGRFRWAKNGERVTTDDEVYRDSVAGIVRRDDVAGAPVWENMDRRKMMELADRPANEMGEHNIQNKDNHGTKDGENEHGNEEEEEDDEDDTEEEEKEQEQDHYADDFHKAKGLAKLKHVSPAVIFDQLLRAQIKRGNKWIFVVDTSFRLYIGIKSPGSFQHSSFLHGARISAAGLIRIKDGQLRTLSPLSGHYRPPAANFRSFVHCMRDEGVDMSHVSISKSYAVLLGVEGYTKTRKRIKKVEGEVKKEVVKLVHHQKSGSHDGKIEKDKKRNSLQVPAPAAENPDKPAPGSTHGGHGHHRGESLGRRLRRSLHLDRDDETAVSLRQQHAAVDANDQSATKSSSSLTPPPPHQQQSRIPEPPPPARAPGGSGPEDGVPPPENKR